MAEKWVSDNVGPEAVFTRATETFGALGKLAQDLPQLVKNAEELSQMVTEGGVRLHPDTARAIAQEQERQVRPWRAAVVILAFLIVVILVMVARHV